MANWSFSNTGGHTQQVRSELAAQIGSVAERLGIGVATAESLTGGQLAADLARAPNASSWFRGGIVAFATEVKREILFVRPGPVVSARTVRDMADGVALLMDASAAVAVSGVAGPLSLEDHPPGTVWSAVRCGASTIARLDHLQGDPDEVRERTCMCALGYLLRSIEIGVAIG